jgi:hypothetical protein
LTTSGSIHHLPLHAFMVLTRKNIILHGGYLHDWTAVTILLDFKLSPCSVCCMFSCGQFPGVRRWEITQKKTYNRLPYLPPVLTSCEHQNSGAVLSHQLSPNIRKGICLFEGSGLLIRAVLKIKMIFESWWTATDRGNRIRGGELLLNWVRRFRSCLVGNRVCCV